MPADAFRCSESAEARGEPLYGTASFVRRWLLLEQPGSWGRDALTQSRLPAAVAHELRSRGRAMGVRIVLIRRGVRLSTDRRQCYFVRTDGGKLYQAHIELDKIDDLLDIDLAALRDGPIPEATERHTPVFLVCTHGRRDQCCSIRGNQVSRVACGHPDLDAWECSHIGGDRFAANLVCFPHGLYYGRVTPGGVTDLMEAYAQGVLSLEHYRGFCCRPFPVQAAEYFARRETLTMELDGIALAGSEPIPTGVRAHFSVASGGTAQIEVRVTRDTRERLTCTSAGTDPIPIYELESCELR